MGLFICVEDLRKSFEVEQKIFCLIPGLKNWSEVKASNETGQGPKALMTALRHFWPLLQGFLEDWALSLFRHNVDIF